MTISLDEVRLLIEASLPGAQVEVVDETGTQDHPRATVTAPQFEGFLADRAAQAVKKAVQSRFDECSIHGSRSRWPSPANGYQLDCRDWKGEPLGVPLPPRAEYRVGT